jgi:RecB family exonuclease
VSRVLRVSPSEISKFMRCRRQWALTYYYKWGVNPATATPVSKALLGTRIHAAMEAYYGYGIDPISALAAIYDEARRQRPDYIAELTAEQDWATIMVSGYLEWAEENGLDEEHEVLSTESEIETAFQLTNGEMAIVTGKLDQIVRRTIDGAILLRDWKTVTTLGKVDTILLDPQMRIYSALLANATDGMRVDGALYTMMLRSKRTARATGPFYEQVHIRYNGHEIVNMKTRLRGVLDDMERVIRQLNTRVDHRFAAYPNPITDRCAWDCPFKNMCHMFDDGSRVEDAMAGEFVANADPYGYRKLDLLSTVKAAHGMSSPEGDTHG